MNSSILLTARTPLTQTYAVTFYGHTFFTTVTSDLHEVLNWLTHAQHSVSERPLPDTRSSTFIAVNIRMSRSHPDQMATLQMYYKDSCLIFQLLHQHGGNQRRIASLFNRFIRYHSPEVKIVGTRITEKLAHLEHHTGIHFPYDYECLDLSRLAAIKFRRSILDLAGPNELAREVLQKEILPAPIRVDLSAFEVPELSENQVMYLSNQVFAEVLIAEQLSMN